MMIADEYLQYKAIERFLDSLVLAKPVPHFVASKHEVLPKNPFGLDRIASFLNALGKPHLNNKYLHIAGTSGKTSTTYFTARLFSGQGYHTARFTSPHICSFAEYFTIDGRLPPVRELLHLVEHTKPLIDREYEQKGLGMISYSEYILALALRYFAEKQVDYVALEAFLGGRHDATNVIERAEVSILTNVGLDHTHILGSTLPEIAAEKVGIMKPGCPFITGEQRPELLTLFRQEARKYETSVEVLGEEFRLEQVYAGKEGTTFDYLSDQHTYHELRTPICGAYQARNAALAIRALERVTQKIATPIQEDAFRESLLATTIPGRFERVADDPVVILDAAHNPDKMTQFVTYLHQYFHRHDIVFVCAFTSGRTPEAMFAPMLEVSRTFYLTRAIIGFREDEEPLYLKSVLTSLCSSVKAIIALDPCSALEMAMTEARKQGKVVCVTGSAYVVAYLRQRWFPEHKILRFE